MDDAQAVLEKARVAIQWGDKAGARTLLDQLVSSEPNDEEAWLLRAEVAENFNEESDCLQHVLAIDPQNQTARRKCAELLNLHPEQADLDLDKAEADDEKLDLSKISAAPVVVDKDEDAKPADPPSKAPPAEPTSENSQDVSLLINRLAVVGSLIYLSIYFSRYLPTMILIIPGLAFVLLLLGWAKKVFIDKEGPLSPATGFIWMAMAFTVFLAAIWYYYGGMKAIFR